MSDSRALQAHAVPCGCAGQIYAQSGAETLLPRLAPWLGCTTLIWLLAAAVPESSNAQDKVCRSRSSLKRPCFCNPGQRHARIWDGERVCETKHMLQTLFPLP